MKSTTVLRPEWVWTEEGLRTNVSLVLTDKIVEISSEDRHPDAEPLPGTLLLPGFVNAHSHAFQRAIRGHVQWSRTGGGDFWTWRERMYRAANGLSPEGIEAVSRLAFLEMVEAGFTTVGEFHYLHRDPRGRCYADPNELALRVIRAARDVGMRIALLRVVYARGGLGVELGPDQQRFLTESAGEALGAIGSLGEHPDPLVSVGLAPHSVRAVPEAWMAELSTFGGPVHAHVSEQPAEVEATLAHAGCTPLELLARPGLVHERFTAVHLTHPTPSDIDVMSASGARIAVCPTTELDLGDGFLPVEARERLPMCIGTDSHAQIDPFAEARALELHGRAVAGRRNILSPPGKRHGLAERLLGALTHEGAASLRLSVGRIAVGAPADLVAVDLNRTGALGVPPLEAAVFNANPDWVSEVWVAGQRVVSGGRHPRRQEILQAADVVLRAL